MEWTVKCGVKKCLVLNHVNSNNRKKEERKMIQSFHRQVKIALFSSSS